MLSAVRCPLRAPLQRGACVTSRRVVLCRTPVRTSCSSQSSGDAAQSRRGGGKRPKGGDLSLSAPDDPLAAAGVAAHNRLAKSLVESAVKQPKGEAVDAPPASQDADEVWDNWQEFFEECDRAQTVLDALEGHLQEAVAEENYAEASRIRTTIEALKQKDAVAGIMRALQEALQGERFAEAARLRDMGAGLVGWWAGRDQPTDTDEPGDPYGCIMRIYPGHGRFVGHMYTARDLASLQEYEPSRSGEGFELVTGCSVLELFVQKDPSGANAYKLQPVAVYGNDTLVAFDGDESEDEQTQDEDEDTVPEETGGSARPTTNIDLEALAKANKDADAETMARRLEEQLAELAEQFNETIEKSADKPAEMRTLPISIHTEVTIEEEFEDDDLISLRPTRVAAKLTPDGRNAFLFEHSVPIDDDEDEEEEEEEWVEAVEQEPAAARVQVGGDGASDDGTPQRLPRLDGSSTTSDEEQADMAEKWKNITAEIDKLSVSRDPKTRAALIKAVQEAAEAFMGQQGDEAAIVVEDVPGMAHFHALTPRMRFERLDPVKAAGKGLDPLEQLYIGGFGPHGPEVIEMRRGRWGEETGYGDEYVTAFKVTGDPNVPSGMATYRAKVCRENKLNPQDVYPEELGVVARYKGEGRVAKPGFQDPSWTEGELLILDGKATQLTGGAEVGFVWSVPGERRFLILFSRLKLPA